MLSYQEMVYVEEMLKIFRKMPKPDPEDHLQARKAASMSLANDVAEVLEHIVSTKSYTDMVPDDAVILKREDFIRRLSSIPCPCVWERYMGESSLNFASAVVKLLESYWEFSLC